MSAPTKSIITAMLILSGILALGWFIKDYNEKLDVQETERLRITCGPETITDGTRNATCIMLLNKRARL